MSRCRALILPGARAAVAAAGERPLRNQTRAKKAERSDVRPFDIFTMSWTGIDALDEHIELQRRYVVEKAPAFDRLLTVLQSLLAGAFKERLEAAWEARVFHAAYERPALLQAALRWAALTGGPGHPLYAGLVSPVSAQTITATSLSEALGDERVLEVLARRTVQTNETARAVAWLWPAEMIARKQPGAGISLFDIGASAGLNLIGDRLEAPWTDENGRPLLFGTDMPRVAARVGFDRSPLDVRNPDDALWLEACIWPGQTDRVERLHKAILAFKQFAAEEAAPVIERCSVSDVPARLDVKGSRAIAYQTIVKDYLSPDERARYEEAMRDWLAASPGRYCWIELEIKDHDAPPQEAATITAHVFQHAECQSFELARCHPHPDRLVVDEDRAKAFFSALV